MGCRVKPLIINLRGNSGAGKTYWTREFMKQGSFESSKSWNATWKNYDTVGDYKGQDWAVLGSYSNTCGGCDTIKTQAEIVERISCYVKDGFNVWLEGLILSTIYGTVGAFSERFEDRWVFAYLQPPIDVLIARIQARRAAAGNLKPLNEANTRARVATIERNKAIVRSHGRRVVELNWEKPLPELLKLVKKEGAR